MHEICEAETNWYWHFAIKLDLPTKIFLNKTSALHIQSKVYPKTGWKGDWIWTPKPINKTLTLSEWHPLDIVNLDWYASCKDWSILG